MRSRLVALIMVVAMMFSTILISGVIKIKELGQQNKDLLRKMEEQDKFNKTLITDLGILTQVLKERNEQIFVNLEEHNRNSIKANQDLERLVKIRHKRFHKRHRTRGVSRPQPRPQPGPQPTQPSPGFSPSPSPSPMPTPTPSPVCVPVFGVCL